MVLSLLDDSIRKTLSSWIYYNKIFALVYENVGTWFQVNQKMILTLTASIMSWCLKHPHDERTVGTSDNESGSQLETTSNSTLDDSASDSSVDENGNM